MGANRLHSPSHAAFSTSVKLSKSNPRAFSRSVMPCVNPVKVLLICSQMAIVAFLTPILEGIQMTFETIWNAISNTISTVLTAIQDVVTTVWNAVSGFKCRSDAL